MEAGQKSHEGKEDDTKLEEAVRMEKEMNVGEIQEAEGPITQRITETFMQKQGVSIVTKPHQTDLNMNLNQGQGRSASQAVVSTLPANHSIDVSNCCKCGKMSRCFKCSCAKGPFGCSGCKSPRCQFRPENKDLLYMEVPVGTPVPNRVETSSHRGSESVSYHYVKKEALTSQGETANTENTEKKISYRELPPDLMRSLLNEQRTPNSEGAFVLPRVTHSANFQSATKFDANTPVEDQTIITKVAAKAATLNRRPSVQVTHTDKTVTVSDTTTHIQIVPETNKSSRHLPENELESSPSSDESYTDSSDTESVIENQGRKFVEITVGGKTMHIEIVEKSGEESGASDSDEYDEYIVTSNGVKSMDPAKSGTHAVKKGISKEGFPPKPKGKTDRSNSADKNKMDAFKDSATVEQIMPMQSQRFAKEIVDKKDPIKAQRLDVGDVKKTGALDSELAAKVVAHRVLMDKSTPGIKDDTQKIERLNTAPTNQSKVLSSTSKPQSSEIYETWSEKTKPSNEKPLIKQSLDPTQQKPSVRKQTEADLPNANHGKVMAQSSNVMAPPSKQVKTVAPPFKQRKAIAPPYKPGKAEIQSAKPQMKDNSTADTLSISRPRKTDNFPTDTSPAKPRKRSNFPYDMMVARPRNADIYTSDISDKGPKKTDTSTTNVVVPRKKNARVAKPRKANNFPTDVSPTLKKTYLPQKNTHKGRPRGRPRQADSFPNNMPAVSPQKSDNSQTHTNQSSRKANNVPNGSPQISPRKISNFPTDALIAKPRKATNFLTDTPSPLPSRRGITVDIPAKMQVNQGNTDNLPTTKGKQGTSPIKEGKSISRPVSILKTDLTTAEPGSINIFQALQGIKYPLPAKSTNSNTPQKKPKISKAKSQEGTKTPLKTVKSPTPAKQSVQSEQKVVKPRAAQVKQPVSQVKSPAASRSSMSKPPDVTPQAQGTIPQTVRSDESNIPLIQHIQTATQAMLSSPVIDLDAVEAFQKLKQVASQNSSPPLVTPCRIVPNRSIIKSVEILPKPIEISPKPVEIAPKPVEIAPKPVQYAAPLNVIAASMRKGATLPIGQSALGAQIRQVSPMYIVPMTEVVKSKYPAPNQAPTMMVANKSWPPTRVLTPPKRAPRQISSIDLTSDADEQEIEPVDIMPAPENTALSQKSSLAQTGTTSRPALFDVLSSPNDELTWTQWKNAIPVISTPDGNLILNMPRDSREKRIGTYKKKSHNRDSSSLDDSSATETDRKKVAKSTKLTSNKRMSSDAKAKKSSFEKKKTTASAVSSSSASGRRKPFYTETYTDDEIAETIVICHDNKSLSPRQQSKQKASKVDSSNTSYKSWLDEYKKGPTLSTRAASEKHRAKAIILREKKERELRKAKRLEKTREIKKQYGSLGKVPVMLTLEDKEVANLFAKAPRRVTGKGRVIVPPRRFTPPSTPPPHHSGQYRPHSRRVSVPPRRLSPSPKFKKYDDDVDSDSEYEDIDVETNSISSVDIPKPKKKLSTYLLNKYKKNGKVVKSKDAAYKIADGREKQRGKVIYPKYVITCSEAPPTARKMIKVTYVEPAAVFTNTWDGKFRQAVMGNSKKRHSLPSSFETRHKKQNNVSSISETGSRKRSEHLSFSATRPKKTGESILRDFLKSSNARPLTKKALARRTVDRERSPLDGSRSTSVAKAASKSSLDKGPARSPESIISRTQDVEIKVEVDVDRVMNHGIVLSPQVDTLLQRQKQWQPQVAVTSPLTIPINPETRKRLSYPSSPPPAKRVRESATSGSSLSPRAPVEPIVIQPESLNTPRGIIGRKTGTASEKAKTVKTPSSSSPNVADNARARKTRSNSSDGIDTHTARPFSPKASHEPGKRTALGLKLPVTKAATSKTPDSSHNRSKSNIGQTSSIANKLTGKQQEVNRRASLGSPLTASSPESGVNRGRGRPRKSSSDEARTSKPSFGLKRGRGRPSKSLPGKRQFASTKPVFGINRGRGRPRKFWPSKMQLSHHMFKRKSLRSADMTKRTLRVRSPSIGSETSSTKSESKDSKNKKRASGNTPVLDDKKKTSPELKSPNSSSRFIGRLRSPSGEFAPIKKVKHAKSGKSPKPVREDTKKKQRGNLVKLPQKASPVSSTRRGSKDETLSGIPAKPSPLTQLMRQIREKDANYVQEKQKQLVGEKPSRLRGTNKKAVADKSLISSPQRSQFSSTVKAKLPAMRAKRRSDITVSTARKDSASGKVSIGEKVPILVIEDFLKFPVKDLVIGNFLKCSESPLALPKQCTNNQRNHYVNNTKTQDKTTNFTPTQSECTPLKDPVTGKFLKRDKTPSVVQMQCANHISLKDPGSCKHLKRTKRNPINPEQNPKIALKESDSYTLVKELITNKFPKPTKTVAGQKLSPMNPVKEPSACTPVKDSITGKFIKPSKTVAVQKRSAKNPLNEPSACTAVRDFVTKNTVKASRTPVVQKQSAKTPLKGPITGKILKRRKAPVISHLLRLKRTQMIIACARKRRNASSRKLMKKVSESHIKGYKYASTQKQSPKTPLKDPVTGRFLKRDKPTPALQEPMVTYKPSEGSASSKFRSPQYRKSTAFIQLKRYKIPSVPENQCARTKLLNDPVIDKSLKRKKRKPFAPAKSACTSDKARVSRKFLNNDKALIIVQEQSAETQIGELFPRKLKYTDEATTVVEKQSAKTPIKDPVTGKFLKHDKAPPVIQGHNTRAPVKDPVSGKSLKRDKADPVIQCHNARTSVKAFVSGKSLKCDKATPVIQGQNQGTLLKDPISGKFLKHDKATPVIQGQNPGTPVKDPISGKFLKRDKATPPLFQGHNTRTSVEDPLSDNFLKRDKVTPVIQGHNTRLSVKDPISGKFLKRDKASPVTQGQNPGTLVKDPISGKFLKRDKATPVIQGHNTRTPVKDPVSGKFLKHDIASRVIQGQSTCTPVKDPISGKFLKLIKAIPVIQGHNTRTPVKNPVSSKFLKHDIASRVIQGQSTCTPVKDPISGKFLKRDKVTPVIQGQTTLGKNPASGKFLRQNKCRSIALLHSAKTKMKHPVEKSCVVALESLKDPGTSTFLKHDGIPASSTHDHLKVSDPDRLEKCSNTLLKDLVTGKFVKKDIEPVIAIVPRSKRTRKPSIYTQMPKKVKSSSLKIKVTVNLRKRHKSVSTFNKHKSTPTATKVPGTAATKSSKSEAGTPIPPISPTLDEETYQALVRLKQRILTTREGAVPRQVGRSRAQQLLKKAAARHSSVGMVTKHGRKATSVAAVVKNSDDSVNKKGAASAGYFISGALEAIDKNNPDYTCVASVTALKGDFIRIHFDGWEPGYDFWCRPDSSYIHPVGWCLANDKAISPPQDWPDMDNFTWEAYLAKKKTRPIPLRAFKKIKSNLKVKTLPHVPMVKELEEETEKSPSPPKPVKKASPARAKTKVPKSMKPVVEIDRLMRSLSSVRTIDLRKIDVPITMVGSGEGRRVLYAARQPLEGATLPHDEELTISVVSTITPEMFESGSGVHVIGTISPCAAVTDQATKTPTEQEDSNSQPSTSSQNSTVDVEEDSNSQLTSSSQASFNLDENNAHVESNPQPLISSEGITFEKQNDSNSRAMASSEGLLTPHEKMSQDDSNPQPSTFSKCSETRPDEQSEAENLNSQLTLSSQVSSTSDGPKSEKLCSDSNPQIPSTSLESATSKEPSLQETALVEEKEDIVQSDKEKRALKDGHTVHDSTMNVEERTVEGEQSEALSQSVESDTNAVSTTPDGQPDQYTCRPYAENDTDDSLMEREVSSASAILANDDSMPTSQSEEASSSEVMPREDIIQHDSDVSRHIASATPLTANILDKLSEDYSDESASRKRKLSGDSEEKYQEAGQSPRFSEESSKKRKLSTDSSETDAILDQHVDLIKYDIAQDQEPYSVQQSEEINPFDNFSSSAPPTKKVRLEGVDQIDSTDTDFLKLFDKDSSHEKDESTHRECKQEATIMDQNNDPDIGLVPDVTTTASSDSNLHENESHAVSSSVPQYQDQTASPEKSPVADTLVDNADSTTFLPVVREELKVSALEGVEDVSPNVDPSQIVQNQYTALVEAPLEEQSHHESEIDNANMTQAVKPMDTSESHNVDQQDQSNVSLIRDESTADKLPHTGTTIAKPAKLSNAKVEEDVTTKNASKFDMHAALNEENVLQTDEKGLSQQAESTVAEADIEAKAFESIIQFAEQNLMTQNTAENITPLRENNEQSSTVKNDESPTHEIGETMKDDDVDTVIQAIDNATTPCFSADVSTKDPPTCKEILPSTSSKDPSESCTNIQGEKAESTSSKEETSSSPEVASECDVTNMVSQILDDVITGVISSGK